MLNIAYKYREPISATYNNCIENSANFLIDSDWEVVNDIVRLLSKFYQATLNFGGSCCPSVNNIFLYIAEIAYLLFKFKDNEIYGDVIIAMKEKIKKYFFPIPVIFQIGAILNPCIKLFYAVELTRVLYEHLEIAEGEKPDLETAKSSIFSNVSALYDYYHKLIYSVTPNIPTSDSTNSSQKMGGTTSFRSCTVWDEFVALQRQSRIDFNELDFYLKLGTEDRYSNIDILQWWKDNSKEFPVLSKMARDLLNIPVSTVALVGPTLEMLVCFKDWVRSDRRNQGIEEKQSEDKKLEDVMTMSSDGESHNQSPDD